MPVFGSRQISVLHGKGLRLARHFRLFYARQKHIDVMRARSFDVLPVVSREDLCAWQDGADWRLASFITQTSGSTGRALTIARPRACHAAHVRRQVDIYRAAGIRKGDRVLNLLSYSISGAARIIDEALRMLGACPIPQGSLQSEKDVAAAVGLARRLRPRVVLAYVNEVFDLFAAMARGHSIRTCILTGEMLRKNFGKKIARLGAVEVLNNYGSMEFSGFAVSAGGDMEEMLLVDDGLLVEVQQEDGRLATEGRGRIVVTDLKNSVMPLVRYALGDRVDVRRRGKKMYLRVLGRMQDTILLDGEVFSAAEIRQGISGILGDGNCRMLVDKDAQTQKDIIVVCVRAGLESRIPAVKGYLARELGLLHVARVSAGELPGKQRVEDGCFISDLRGRAA